MGAEEEERMFLNPREACIEEEDDGSLMIVWDTLTGVPVRTIPIGKYGGAVCCSMSADGMYIATVNRRTPQEIMMWGWTVDETQLDDFSWANSAVEYNGGDLLAPEYVRRIPAQDEQTCVRFSVEDPHLLCTNGLRRVMFWSWVEGKLKYYSPPVLQKDLNAPALGNFTQTVLIPGTHMACTGTVEGDVVLWQLQPRDRVRKVQDKELYKTVKVHQGGVTYLTTEGGYIVTGGMDGQVKFLDTRLRLVAWFEELNGGPVVSLSFDRLVQRPIEETLQQTAKAMERNALATGNAANTFTAPDFMISTANAMIIDVPSKSFHTNKTVNELRRGKLIVQGQDQAVQSVVSHPKLPQLAVAGLSGGLHIWDYRQRRVRMLTIFRGLLIQCMAYDPTGELLVCGFTNGTVKVLSAETLEEKQIFKPKKPDCIVRLAFSPDSKMFVYGTLSGTVALFHCVHHNQDPTKPMEWELIGRHKTHRAAISGLQFMANTNGEALRLISVGEDKRLIEYNLAESDPENGLLLRTAHRISQGPSPTGFLWVKEPNTLDAQSKPRGGMDMMMDQDVMNDVLNGGGLNATSEGDEQDYLFIATDEYKIGIYLSDWSRQCVKTVLSPTFGGPISGMAVVPADPTDPSGKDRCLAYCTKERVIGLVGLPLRGDPFDAVGLLAHPGPIVSMATSYDGRYLFTAGGEDQSMMQWRIDGRHILPKEDRQAERVPLDHLLATVEGGAEGELMKEVLDYFYYAQIRTQGEETSAKRELLGAVRFSQLPNLFRSLGYYPSELEIGHLTFEVANMYGPRDEPLEEVDVDNILLDFSQFMRLYVNYRPVYGVTREHIERAFLAIGADPHSGVMERDAFFNVLSTRGEPLRTTEITAALGSLLGDGVRVDMLEDHITARVFAENLLGFEDYDIDGQGNPAMMEEEEEESEEELQLSIE
ncbi:hypothetical protein AGDE_04020 [Angomonas deanei]|uniref:Cilia- and flagella-associated protein 251 n=1 Tax=Angomonas deanei TaxID=59799 RepID=A0A7G2CEF9_9TRYP|nr:hypothetical protein AGDE_04020 [Angomonas deanei]CAD2217341.1 WD domain, G-beta repeat, putative [Angomonas deanei]|eukprot:EPY39908.1 hypothetical protein AGDE_04020 [Angomonas deanei]